MTPPGVCHHKNNLYHITFVYRKLMIFSISSKKKLILSYQIVSLTNFPSTTNYYLNNRHYNHHYSKVPLALLHTITTGSGNQISCIHACCINNVHVCARVRVRVRVHAHLRVYKESACMCVYAFACGHK